MIQCDATRKHEMASSCYECLAFRALQTCSGLCWVCGLAGLRVWRARKSVWTWQFSRPQNQLAPTEFRSRCSETKFEFGFGFSLFAFGLASLIRNSKFEIRISSNQFESIRANAICGRLLSHTQKAATKQTRLSSAAWLGSVSLESMLGCSPTDPI